jgi:hypothetical protein
MITKNQEPTRQFSEIYRMRNDKDYIAKMKLKEKSKMRNEYKKKDLGL